MFVVSFCFLFLAFSRPKPWTSWRESAVLWAVIGGRKRKNVIKSDRSWASNPRRHLWEACGLPAWEGCLREPLSWGGCQTGEMCVCVCVCGGVHACTHNWLISLGIMSSRFIHMVANISTSFFFKNNILLYVYTSFCLSIRHQQTLGLLLHFSYCE